MEYIKSNFELGAGLADRAAIGLVVLATDSTIEYEWRKLINVPGVVFFETRIHNEAEITKDNLKKMELDLSSATDLIRPGEKMDVVAFGCTSGSMVIGEEAIEKRIKEVRKESKVTNPISALFAAMKALKAQKIAVLTPYIKPLNDHLVEFLSAKGLEVVKFASFEHENDNEVAKISAESIRTAIRELAKAQGIDAIFVSCTSLVVVPLIKELEDELGLPITSSNHAMAWHALRLAGIDDEFPSKGKLFTV